MTRPLFDWSEAFTIPNLVSFARVLLVGLLWWLIAGDQAVWAAWLMILMAATDWLDGWLARRLDRVTDLGAVLDTVGDGLLVASAVLGGMVKTWVPLVVGVLILVRTALVAAWSAWVAARARQAISVHRVGKVAITFLFIAVPAFYFASAASDPLRLWLAALGWVTAAAGVALYWWAGLRYIRDGYLLTRQ